MTIPTIDRRKQLKNRLIISIFFIGFSAGIWSLLSIATPYVESLRKEGVLGQVFFKITEIRRADLLVVQHEDEVYDLKLMGIRCPNPSWVHDPEFADWTWTQRDLVQLEATASKALSTWVYQRQVALEPSPTPEQSASGETLLARATLSKVDLGRKRLQIGQVMMSDETHDWEDIYILSQNEAINEGHGLWRFKPKKQTTPSL